MGRQVKFWILVVLVGNLGGLILDQRLRPVRRGDLGVVLCRTYDPKHA